MHVYAKSTKRTCKIFSEKQCIVKITDGKLYVNSNNRLKTDLDVHKNERREWFAGRTYVTDSAEEQPKVIINPIASC